MRFLCGLAGGICGIVLGGAGAYLLAIAGAGGNALLAGAILLLAGAIGVILGAVHGALLSLRLMDYLGQTGVDAPGRSRKWVVAVSLVVAIPAMAAGMIALADDLRSPPPDRQLLANFARHHASLERVVTMLKTDRGLQRVDADWTIPEHPDKIGVTAARIGEYRRLLRRAGTARGFQVGEDKGDVQFFYWLQGSAVSSDTMKGCAYRMKPPPNARRSLDGIKSHGPGATREYRHIRGNWYLFYEFAPG